MQTLVPAAEKVTLLMVKELELVGVLERYWSFIYCLDYGALLMERSCTLQSSEVA